MLLFNSLAVIRLHGIQNLSFGHSSLFLCRFGSAVELNLFITIQHLWQLMHRYLRQLTWMERSGITKYLILCCRQ